LLEIGRRLLPREVREGAHARAVEIDHGLVPQLARKGTVAETAEMLIQAVGVEPLDGVDDGAVELPAPLVKERLVGDGMGEGMAETEALRGRVEQLGMLQMGCLRSPSRPTPVRWATEGAGLADLGDERRSCHREKQHGRAVSRNVGRSAHLAASPAGIADT
jgi:hypothetical protein